MRVRQGNDFIFLWAIERNGEPEDLSNAVNIKLHFKNFDRVSEVKSFQIVDGNIVRVEVSPEWASRLGAYSLILSYAFEDESLADNDRKCVVDVLAFNIVSKTSEADDITEMAKTTDIMIGLRGLSAYEVWLKDNPESTKEDYYNWLRQPATDAVSLIDDKIEHLDEVIETLTENEAERVTAEQGRRDAEFLRNDAEGIRDSNEIDRIEAEGIRDANETDRINAESNRVDAEDLRDQAEVAREDAERLRQTNTNTAIQNAVEATTAANTAAGLANNAATAANTAAGDANNAAEAANTAAELADTARTELTTAVNTKLGEADAKIEEMDTTLSTYDGRVTQVESDITQLESDVEQLAYVKIKNEAVNGDLENGLIAPFSIYDGSGGVSTLTINSSTPISGNYDIRLTIITPSTQDGRPIFYGLDRAANIGEKIYLHFYAKILSGTPTIFGFHSGAGNRSIYGGAVVNGRNTRIIDVEGTGGSLGRIYFDSTSVWDMQMDNFMRINLTKTFGAGNEPTEEEMNLLLDMLPVDYFEGEITIPAQKIMQWQLKLIRKNKNAIIALGGTII